MFWLPICFFGERMPMRSKRPLPVRRAGLFVGSAALLGTAQLTRADVKIVTEVTVTGLPTHRAANPDAAPPPDPANSSASASTQPPPPNTITTYCKGKMARIESADGLVPLYDGAANKVYTLNPARKSYAVTSAKKAFELRSE